VNVKPRRSRRLVKYGAVATTAVRQELAERATLAGRVVFYAVLLTIFSRLWVVVQERGALSGANAADFLWYLAVTEWVVLSVPLVHLTVEADVRSGDIAYQLPRPISYLGARVAEAGGAQLVRFAVLGVAGFVFAWGLAGSLPSRPEGLLLALVLAPLAAFTCTLFATAVGFSALWLQDAAPVYWIWQKCMFLLGGLLLPLEIYPEWLREIASVLPFAAMLHGPGRSALGFDVEHALRTGALLVFWAGVAIALLVVLLRRGLRVLDVNGG